jgi:hypothetical protein
MKYLTDHSNHFQGNAYKYTLQCALRESHHPNEEAVLFDYLLTPTFVSASHPDTRAAQAYCIHLPYPWRAMVIQVLYQQELSLAQEQGLDSQSSIVTPIFTLSKLSLCLQEQLPSILISCLNSHNPLESISKVFGVPLKYQESEYISMRLGRLLEPSGLDRGLISSLCDLSITGDRYMAGISLAKVFGYSGARILDLNRAISIWYSANV